MMDKRVMRAAARARREAFAAGGPPLILPDARFLARLLPGMVVASYAPTGGEADPVLLEDAAVAAGCRIALPYVIDKATPLRFLVRGAEPLVSGPFGLRNPHAHWDEVAPDVILTPLLAFDAMLDRLGQGAGHYDRAFATLPAAWRVGVAWSVQQVDRLVPDPWDMPLHAIITENDWWTR